MRTRPMRADRPGFQSVNAGRGFDWATGLRTNLPREKRPSLKIVITQALPTRMRRQSQQYMTCRKGLSLKCL